MCSGIFTANGSVLIAGQAGYLVSGIGNALPEAREGAARQPTMRPRVLPESQRLHMDVATGTGAKWRCRNMPAGATRPAPPCLFGTLYLKKSINGCIVYNI